MSEQKRIPQHVAIIMDGNGRWAGLHGKERYEGHAAGVEPVRASLRARGPLGRQVPDALCVLDRKLGTARGEVDPLMELF